MDDLAARRATLKALILTNSERAFDTHFPEAKNLSKDEDMLESFAVDLAAEQNVRLPFGHHFDLTAPMYIAECIASINWDAKPSESCLMFYRGRLKHGKAEPVEIDFDDLPDTLKEIYQKGQ